MTCLGHSELTIDQSQDFLVQLNVTELLTQLAITSHGHKYLETTGVMETMGVMLRDCPNLPFADVIMPGKDLDEKFKLSLVLL